MRDMRFYVEPEGTVCVVVVSSARSAGSHFGYGKRPTRIPVRDVVYDAYATVDAFRSHIGGTTTTRGYLRAHCRRVSEARAREVHPELFAYLEGS